MPIGWKINRVGRSEGFYVKLGMVRDQVREYIGGRKYERRMKFSGIKGRKN